MCSDSTVVGGPDGFNAIGILVVEENLLQHLIVVYKVVLLLLAILVQQPIGIRLRVIGVIPVGRFAEDILYSGDICPRCHFG